MAATPWRRILCGLALIFCIGPAAAAEPVYPQLTSRIVDDADLLSQADRAELDAELKALEDKSSDQGGRRHLALAARLHHRGFRLSARPPLGHRHQGEGQRRPPDRRSQ